MSWICRDSKRQAFSSKVLTIRAAVQNSERDRHPRRFTLYYQNVEGIRIKLLVFRISAVTALSRILSSKLLRGYTILRWENLNFPLVALSFTFGLFVSSDHSVHEFPPHVIISRPSQSRQLSSRYGYVQYCSLSILFITLQLGDGDSSIPLLITGFAEFLIGSVDINDNRGLDGSWCSFWCICNQHISFTPSLFFRKSLSEGSFWVSEVRFISLLCKRKAMFHWLKTSTPYPLFVLCTKFYKNTKFYKKRLPWFPFGHHRESALASSNLLIGHRLFLNKLWSCGFTFLLFLNSSYIQLR